MPGGGSIIRLDLVSPRLKLGAPSLGNEGIGLDGGVTGARTRFIPRKAAMTCRHMPRVSWLLRQRFYKEVLR